MNFGQSFRLALKSLTTSKMRALLTMLGIIIGVGAVIVILSLGNGLTGMVRQQVDKIGINMIQVNIWGRGDEYPDPQRDVPPGGSKPGHTHRRIPLRQCDGGGPERK